MNNRYETTAKAIKQAESALVTLKQFTDNQYKAKGETMLEQITDYIATTLYDADYMCEDMSNRWRGLALRNRGDYFEFYISIDEYSHYQLFKISIDGKITYYRQLREDMMLVLVENWDIFKKNLDVSIKRTMEKHVKDINKQLSHISYVNEQLSKWKV